MIKFVCSIEQRYGQYLVTLEYKDKKLQWLEEDRSIALNEVFKVLEETSI